VGAAEPPKIDPAAFAESDEEAASRFERWRATDPFPEIASALLNTQDVIDYIAATGMVWPFRPDQNDLTRNLKPATCAIPIGGLTLWWRDDPNDSDHPSEIAREVNHEGEGFVIEKNSIVYITLEPTFRIPEYIAARFNLKIQSVYRGLLVGTGPLVDPGFVGRLSVPVHNLTSNDYHYRYGEALVWMEFTKLSPLEKWKPEADLADQPERGVGSYVAFPERKLGNLTVRDYAKRAHDGPIVSSIPVLVGRAQQSATRAEQTVASYQRRFFGVSIIAGLVLFATITTLVVASWQLWKTIDGDVTNLRGQVSQIQGQAPRGTLQTRITRLEAALRRICGANPHPKGC
jgi:deoxycytidine triphosphate deaminase